MFIENYKADALASFRNYKKMAERAIEQVNEQEFFTAIDAEANSIAIIVKHVAGNLHSRWQDFLITDGEKPTRNRDTEFELIDDTRESLMQFWESGWKTLFDNVEPLTSEDYEKTITIRGEPHSVVEAINRQLTHYSYHIGQIVLLAKHFRSSEWKTLSIPRNKSAEFNKFVEEELKAGELKTERLETSFEFSGRLNKKAGR